jgi:hypothetical protein
VPLSEEERQGRPFVGDFDLESVTELEEFFEM